MRDRIVSELRQIESAQQVRVLYACESGSRAWGFPSTDSDYDVRFIYVRTKDWYLSIDDKRDVIECPVTDLLDISGWDIRKALRLLRKSNPPLMEWLRSPIVYLEQYPTAAGMRDLASGCFSPRSCLHHYINMAKCNFREYLQGDTVRAKKYFYVLRPVLACKWIETYNTMPPMEFPTLVASLIPDGVLAHKIAELLDRKMAGEELDSEPKIAVINGFLEQELLRLAELARMVGASCPPDTTDLDAFFRETLSDAWME
jgi:uncharacterized protein